MDRRIELNRRRKRNGNDRTRNLLRGNVRRRKRFVRARTRRDDFEVMPNVDRLRQIGFGGRAVDKRPAARRRAAVPLIRRGIARRRRNRRRSDVDVIDGRIR